MKAISEENARENSPSVWRWRSWPRWIPVACAAALLLLLLPVLPVRNFLPDSPAVALLTQSVHAMSNVQTVHITGRIRTLPQDNFELIGAQYDFVPIELWREYTNPPRWRVEKPGRVVVMNGQSALLYISATNSAMTGSPQAGFIDWLRPLLDPESILGNESAAARQGAAQATLAESEGTTTLTMRRQARGNFANDWARNKSIPASDHTCIYHFNSVTKRLEGLQVVITVDGADVVVAEFTGFSYNEVFPQSLYTVLLPPDVDWLVSPNAKSAQAAFHGPKEVAAWFFDSLAREDWDAFLQVSSGSTVQPSLKKMFGGLHVISIGEPFQSGLYPGYFVPYQVQLRDGSIRTHKLAVKNDIPAHRWFVDGGY